VGWNLISLDRVSKLESIICVEMMFMSAHIHDGESMQVHE
jgi:hypothetical protein